MNPILQAIMPNNGLNNLVNAIKGDPQGIYDEMMRTNPQFKQFVEQNKNKSPEQIASEHGIDLKAIRGFMR